MKCDEFLIYGELIRLEDNCVYESVFNPHSSVIEHVHLGPALNSIETKQINSFSSVFQPFRTELVKAFFTFLNLTFNLEVLDHFLVALVNDLQETNDLPHNLYTATILNGGNLSAIPKIGLHAFSSVKFVSIFEPQDRKKLNKHLK